MADNWGDCDVNADGAGRQQGRSDEVEADVDGAFGGVVGETAGALTLYLMFGTD